MVKYLFVVLSFVCAFAANHKTMPAQIGLTTQTAPPMDWYCDERWQNSSSIYVGTAAEIVPFQDAKLPDKFSGKFFLIDEVEYKIENIVRFKVEKIYRGAKKEEQQEIIIYNPSLGNLSAFDFKTGEKYLVYTKSHGYGEYRGKGTFSKYLNYIASDGKTNPVSESAETIAFLEKVYRLDSTKEILGYEGKDFISGGVIGGKATMLVKPAYPKDAKKEKASGAVWVMVLIDERGSVIKAKAVCARHPSLAKAAEAAALLSKFSPTLIKEKPVKVRGVIVYNFVSQ